MSARCASELTVVELKERLRVETALYRQKKRISVAFERVGSFWNMDREAAGDGEGSAEGTVGMRASEESIYGIKTSIKRKSEHHSRDTSALEAQLEILRREVTEDVIATNCLCIRCKYQYET